MLIATPKCGQSGFTLIELMVGIVVLGILLGIAVPSFQVWIKNTQIRTAAQTVQSGLQLARAQAVARRANVEFTLSGAVGAWSVNTISGVAPAVTIDKRGTNEGALSINATVLPAGATTITFNDLGGVNSTNDANGSNPGGLPLASVTLSSTTANTTAMRVTIGTGGNTRICDPNIGPYSSSNPRGCQP